MEIIIDSKKISRALLTIIAVLTVLHVSQLTAYYVIDDPVTFDFINLLDFDIEANLPSLYSMLAITLCSGVLFLIAAGKKKMQQPFQFHWKLLAWIFLYLAFDEGASIHEDIGDIMELFVTADGYLYFPWVVPYTGLLIILMLVFTRFLLRLPRQTMICFIVSAGVFLTGAIGFEMISAMEADLNGTTTITYSVLYTIEELCEMIGIVIFLRALIDYYSREFGDLKIRFPG